MNGAEATEGAVATSDDGNGVQSPLIARAEQKKRTRKSKNAPLPPQETTHNLALEFLAHMAPQEERTPGSARGVTNPVFQRASEEAAGTVHQASEEKKEDAAEYENVATNTPSEGKIEMVDMITGSGHDDDFDDAPAWLSEENPFENPHKFVHSEVSNSKGAWQ